MTPGENNVYARPDYQAKIIAKVEDGVIGEIKKCTKNAPFCLIRFDGAEGWLPRNILFGVYDSENIS
jgi:SH3-like domain-containing protein